MLRRSLRDPTAANTRNCAEKIISAFAGIDGDRLVEVFERETGLDTSL